MATYQEMVEKYRKRQRDTLVDTLTAGLNYVDDLAVDLGLMEDSGVLGDMMDTVGCALPFALIAVTEQCKVIMGKKDQRAAAENTVYRMAKTGAAMGVGALAFAAGGAVAAIPAAMGGKPYPPAADAAPADGRPPDWAGDGRRAAAARRCGAAAGGVAAYGAAV